MISDEDKNTIDALSMEELLHEAIRGNSSRFQGEKHDYLVTRLALVEKQGEDEHKKNELELAQEANDIAKDANMTSSRAYRMSVISVIVAIIALFAAVLQQCSHMS